MSKENTGKAKRRKVLKTLSVAGASLSGVPLSTNAVGADSIGTEDNTGGGGGGSYDSCPECYHQFTRQQAPDTGSYYNEISSTLHRLNSTYESSGGGYWTHDMRLAGQGAALNDSDELERQITRNLMKLETFDDVLNVFTSKSDGEIGLYPEPRDVFSGGDTVNTATAAMSLAEEVLKASTRVTSATTAIVSAATIADAMVDTMTDFIDSPGDKYEFVGDYTGVKETGHHTFFYVKDNDESQTNSMRVTSQNDYAANVWDLTAESGSLYPSSTMNTMEEATFGDPERMADYEKGHFGVKKVKRSSLSYQPPRWRNDPSKKPNDEIYVAENPPLSISPVTGQELDQIVEENMN